MTDFVHLHTHTEYSLLDGACRIGELLDAVAAAGQTSVAITDHGVMYGAVDFYEEAKKRGLKPIIGCEVYVAPRTRFDKVKELDGEYRHLILLCKNMTGYRNLTKMVSLSFTEGFYSKPRIDMDLLRDNSEGLIALSACLAGEISRAILRDDLSGARAHAVEMDRIFGHGNYYLELQNHGMDEQLKVNAAILRISEETGIPTVATNDVHYVRREDRRMQDVLVCIGTARTLAEDNPLKFPTDEFYLKTGDEMAELFDAESIANTVKIAEQCDLEFEFGKIKLPRFDIGDRDHFEFFSEQCFAGLHRLYGDHPEDSVRERLEYELGVIHKMGYVDYYLIVADFVNYAKSKGIPVGPGRGSGAGSLAAYCIGITGIDPIKYNLLFERFLNPERVSMPDFDIDFCYVRRQEVIDYVISKYGSDHVAQIVTFGTMQARGSVRDVGRVMGLPYNVCDRVAKQIPRTLGMTIDRALTESPELKDMYEGDPQIKELIDMCRRVEGMPRHASRHAAGVVITDRPVAEYVPLSVNDDAVITQYTMTVLEKLGLLKMDFLGLRNLTVISDTLKLLEEKGVELDIDAIPTDDRATLDMLTAGDTEGVFQFESAGMRSVLMQLRPEKIEDLIAVISLYRPGPMDSIPRYVHNRHHPEDVKYSTELLRPILAETYGCIVYQEQVMQIFRDLAGYSLGRADIVRRAMSKKKHDVMRRERDAFINGDKNDDGSVSCEGAVARGVPKTVAESIFDEMSAFSSYAFNKSHAAAYAFLSYQTAYLKCHHTKEYLAALLTSVLDDSAKVAEYIAECTRLGIPVRPPHINHSRDSFTVEGDGIRFGLLAIKNLGAGLINSLLSRREDGPFKSLYDFCDRMYSRELNRRAVESLIKSGAVDGLGNNRKEMLASLDELMADLDSVKKFTSGGQLGLFDSAPDDSIARSFAIQPHEEFPKNELLRFEKEVTGIYLSGHPMQEYSAAAERAGCVRTCDVFDPERAEYFDDRKVKMALMLISVRKKSTKNDQVMATLYMEDMFGAISVLMFPKLLASSAGMLTEGEVFTVYGRVSIREGRDPELICERLEHFDEAAPSSENGSSHTVKRGLYLRVPSINAPEYLRARRIMDVFDGDTPVLVVCRDTGKRLLSPASAWVSPNDVMMRELADILGNENVKLVK